MVVEPRERGKSHGRAIRHRGCGGFVQKVYVRVDGVMRPIGRHCDRCECFWREEAWWSASGAYAGD